MFIAAFVLALLFFLSSILPTSIAQQLHRRVVDDSDPAISYTVGTADAQPGQWAAMDASKQATVCAAVNCWDVLDTSQVYGGTWHEGHGSATISYTFNGTAVAAYFVSSNRAGAVANISFFVDGQLLQTVGGTTNGLAQPLSYNVQAFTISDLSDQSHELLISQNGGSSAMMFDYLTYDEVLTAVATSDGLSTSTAIPLQATTKPVDPLRVPASHGTARSAVNRVGVAVASALIGTLALVVAAKVFLRQRKRRNLENMPIKYETDKEAQLDVTASYRPRPLDLSREQRNVPNRIVSHYAESTTENSSDESDVTQPERPDRRSRFRSAVSTVVAALTPFQITSFSRVELRTALAAMMHPTHQQSQGVQYNTHTDTFDQRVDVAPNFVHLATPVITQPSSPLASSTFPPASITASPSLRSVSSISSSFRPPSVPPTAPLRLPRSLGQSSPPFLPRFTFEERRRHHPDTTMDPEILQRQIQALLWNAPPLPRRASTPSAPPPPYVSRPSTPRASLASRRTTAPPPTGPDGNALPLPPLPPLPPFPEKVARRI